MIQQFHEGQEVEIAVPSSGKVWKSDQTRRTWRKAKIVANEFGHTDRFWVEFSDGSRAVFSAEHIRPTPPQHDAYSAMARGPHAKGFGGLEI
jgi:hypothetical protein